MVAAVARTMAMARLMLSSCMVGFLSVASAPGDWVLRSLLGLVCSFLIVPGLVGGVWRDTPGFLWFAQVAGGAFCGGWV